MTTVMIRIPLFDNQNNQTESIGPTTKSQARRWLRKNGFDQISLSGRSVCDGIWTLRNRKQNKLTIGGLELFIDYNRNVKVYETICQLSKIHVS